MVLYPVPVNINCTIQNSELTRAYPQIPLDLVYVLVDINLTIWCSEIILHLADS